ncbi:hypothetical protein DK389_07280 [Methylobacterium durans]|uniref:Uncharacterized protein n=1 Tax=Methylobacterium durans TaxID=2202825 RepID=A0A2U8W517_9HYPH|nr:hypothetical protein DK389_07280 [Methylobacterium durans]
MGLRAGLGLLPLDASGFGEADLLGAPDAGVADFAAADLGAAREAARTGGTLCCSVSFPTAFSFGSAQNASKMSCIAFTFCV